MCERFNRDYEIYDEIGRGRFGIVYRCYSAADGDAYAVKSIDKRLLLDATDRGCIENEPKILEFLPPHPNVLRLVSLYESDSHLLIVTELLDSSSTLYDRIVRTKVFSEPDAAAIFVPLMVAIAHCHRHGVAHRDVKPENVMFDDRNRLRLCDFGSAEWFDPSSMGERTMSGVVGSPYYVAPEVLSGREYNEKVDVWSAGVILYIMLGGVAPFAGDNVEETFNAVVRANLRFPTRIFRSVSKEAKDLLRKMLCKDVSRRLSAEQVLVHPWVLSLGMTNLALDST
ncbi:hypothetical protein Droror1_Dr00024741 [Drosera rotundifolia]